MIGTQLHNGVPYSPSVPKKVWRKVRKTLVIDSRDRQMNAGSHPGSYTVTLPTVYQNVYAATLKTIELPISFYQFSSASGNATMSFSYNGAATQTITISDGNYSATQLVSEINTQLTNALGANKLIATYSVTTAKVTFTSGTTALNTVPFVLYFTPSVPTSSNGGNSLTSLFTTWWGLGYFLGFQATTYTSAASGSPALHNISGVFSMNPYPTNYILMDLHNMNKLDETSLDDRKAWRVDGAFAKLPVNGNSGQFEYLNDSGTNPLNRSVYNPPIAKLNQLTVKFRLHDGRVLDFNGVENSFSLELELLDNNFDEYSSLEFSP